MFDLIEKINERPVPFEFYTAEELWTNNHTSKQMLAYHLNGAIDVSSRNANFIENSVEWIIRYFKLDGNSCVADFGCGPGLYANKLSKCGANITGIDFSERSINYADKYAKENNLNANYVRCNYLEYNTDKKYDLIIMIMCDFCALSFEQRKTMLEKYYSLLKTGGKLLLDVYSYKAFAKREELAIYEPNQLAGFWSPNKYYGFVNIFKYDQEKVILNKYSIVEENLPIKTVYNWLEYFDKEKLANELTLAGFEIDNFFGNVAGSKFNPQNDEFAVVAKK